MADSVSKRLSTLEADSFPKRLWEHDVTVWTNDPEGQAEVPNPSRLAGLD
jgi:hypothetical protein